MKKEEIVQRLKENKADRKDLKKQLAKLPKFEVNKWYKNLDVLYCLENLDGLGYGFDSCEGDAIYYNDHDTPWIVDDSLLLATETEVFEALKNEAINRGFKEYMTENFLCLDDGAYWSNRNEFSFENNKFGLGANIIMKDGKWATIIKEPTIKLNGEYNIEQLENEIVKLKNK